MIDKSDDLSNWAQDLGPSYPTVTFPGLKKNEIDKIRRVRTQRLVLEAWDRLAAETN